MAAIKIIITVTIRIVIYTLDSMAILLNRHHIANNFIIITIVSVRVIIITVIIIHNVKEHLCVEVFSVQKKSVHVKEYTFYFAKSPHHISDKTYTWF